MGSQEWTTVNLVWRAGPTTFYSRNPFRPGGLVGDSAIGAAAAALGGYLRALGLVALPATISVFQGEELGRPSQLSVRIPQQSGSGISVTGPAVLPGSDRDRCGPGRRPGAARALLTAGPGHEFGSGLSGGDAACSRLTGVRRLTQQGSTRTRAGAVAAALPADRPGR